MLSNLRHFIKDKNLNGFANYLVALSFDWKQLIMKLFDKVNESGGVFHIWGHSWEIEENNLWGDLEEILKYVSCGDNISYKTNGELKPGNV